MQLCALEAFDLLELLPYREIVSWRSRSGMSAGTGQYSDCNHGVPPSNRMLKVASISERATGAEGVLAGASLSAMSLLVSLSPSARSHLLSITATSSPSASFHRPSTVLGPCMSMPNWPWWSACQDAPLLALASDVDLSSTSPLLSERWTVDERW